MPTTAFYQNALNEMALGNIRPLTDTIRFYAVDTGSYTVNLATHSFLSSVPSGARIGWYLLANKAVAGGAFDNTVDPSISNPLGATCGAIIAVKWTGADATSVLLFYDDDFTPVTSDPIGIAIDAGGIWEAA